MDILSKRLRVIADMIQNDGVVADVGCDHGYLSIALIREEKARKAIAMDLRPGPLTRAKENIAKFALEDKIQTRLSDGMKELLPGEVDSVVIAGMGGPLMVRLLEQSPEIVARLSEIILEPQSEPEALREYMCHLPFKIAEEDFVKEEGKYYPVIKYVPAQSKQTLTKEEILFGPILLQKKPILLQKYLEGRALQDENLSKILQQKINAGSAKAGERLKEVIEDKAMIDRLLENW